MNAKSVRRRRRGASKQGKGRQFYLLVAVGLLLSSAALFGGSTYLWAPGWPVLFMIGSVGVAVGAITLLMSENVRPFRGLLLIATATLLLPALQLVPLPPAIWHALPGRDLVQAVDTAAGLDAPWRPLSLFPALTAHALMSLLVPFGILLLAVQLDDRHHELLLWAVLLLITASGLLTIAQLQDPALQGVLGYKVGNEFVATGLFSNRNHQALLIVSGLPLWLAALRLRESWLGKVGSLALPAAVLGGVLIIFAMVLVTGSRSGLVLFGITLAALPWLWPSARGLSALQSRGAPAVVGGVFLLILVLIIAVTNDRAIALMRLLETDPADEMRSVIARQTIAFLGTYWPAGTGIGTFMPVYAMAEPASLLQPEYINQAHNDWLDLVLTGGIAGAALLVATTLYVANLAFGHLSGSSGRGRSVGRCAAMVVLLAGLASAVDFPLRTPLLMSILCLALVWTARPPRAA